MNNSFAVFCAFIFDVLQYGITVRYFCGNFISMYRITEITNKIYSLTTSLFSFKSRRKHILLVFVGDLVLETLHTKYEEWNKLCNLLFLHTDKNLALKYKEFVELTNLYIGDNETNSCGKREFEDGINYAKTNSKQIFKEINRYRNNKVILISTLRYSSASGITSELYNQLTQNNYKTVVLCIKPLKFEGVYALNNYEKAVEMMNNLNSEGLIIIDPNTEMKDLNLVPFVVNKLSALIDNEIGHNH